VQARLGHASIKTTGDVYAYVTKEAARIFGDFIQKTARWHKCGQMPPSLFENPFISMLIDPHTTHDLSGEKPLLVHKNENLLYGADPNLQDDYG
jgi:hypothetical protein